MSGVSTPNVDIINFKLPYTHIKLPSVKRLSPQNHFLSLLLYNHEGYLFSQLGGALALEVEVPGSNREGSERHRCEGPEHATSLTGEDILNALNVRAVKDMAVYGHVMFSEELHFGNRSLAVLCACTKAEHCPWSLESHLVDPSTPFSTIPYSSSNVIFIPCFSAHRLL